MLQCLSLSILGPDHITETTAREAKASLAKQANKVRKQLLEEVRMGHLCGKPLAMLVTAEPPENNDEFRRTVVDAFTELLET